MYYNSRGDNILNIGISMLVTVALFIVISLRFDFFYDINDDLLIKDILSGTYTGSPEAHTNQLLYPLSFMLSLFYRILPAVPVYGVFLNFSMFLCLGMVIYRALSFFKGIRSKIALSFMSAMLVLGMLLKELVFIQYTVTAGFFMGTAVFWILTTPHGLGKKKFLLKNIPSFLCLLLAFLIRQEMALISMPFILCALVFHWMEAYEKQEKELTGFEKAGRIQRIFSKENCMKYILFFLGIIMVMGINTGIDSLAYSSQPWKNFRNFFDARTKVYDYTWYPVYDKAEEFYQEKGISRVQYQLIDSYNFGMDETINEDMLENIADYNEKERHLGGFKGRIKNVIYAAIKAPFGKENITYSSFLLVGYGLVFILLLLQNEKNYGKKILVMFLAGSVCRGYLYYVDRAVNRVVHPLYLIEFLLLAALLAGRLYDRPLWNRERYFRKAAAAVFIVLSVIFIPVNFMAVAKESTEREAMLQKQQELEEYTRKETGNYYYLDVYSMVGFMDKIYGSHNKGKRNYDYAGGWLYHSPLQKKVGLAAVGEKEGNPFSLADALLMDHIFFIAEKSRDINYLKEYYKEKGKEVEIQVKDTLKKSEDPFIVYHITLTQTSAQ